MQEAQLALMYTTTPTTATGMVALLDYLAEFDLPFLMWGEAPDDNEFVIEFIRHVRDGLKGMTVAA